MPALHAAALAPAARAWVARARPARILNVFDRVLNLIDDSGEVLSIVAHERGMTPFGLALQPLDPWPFRSTTALSPVQIHDHEIIVGDVCIDVSQVSPWNPLPDWGGLRATLAADAERMEEVAALALGLGHPAASPPPASLLELYTSPAPSPIPPALAARVLSGAADLVNGFRQGNKLPAIVGARRLAGVGGGLTPAGDDFVVGLCLAAWAGLYPPPARDLCVSIAGAMSPLTTPLSAAYLRAAARGECAAPWHDLFAALTRPAEPARHATLAAAVAALFAVGHTSGADGLAGFLAYNQGIFRRTHENPD